MLDIVIADDHAVVRESLVRALAFEDGLRVVSELATGDDAARIIAELAPDVALLDVGLPVEDGISIGRRLRRTAPQVRLVYLSMHDDDATLRAVLPVGPDGYLLKTESVARVAAAIRSAVEGRPVFSEPIGDRMRELKRAEHHRPPDPSAVGMERIAELLSELDRRTGVGVSVSPAQRTELRRLAQDTRRTRSRLLGPFEELTARERYVLARLIDGRCAEAIAADAYVSLSTVRSQIRSILRKLGVNSQLEAVALARRAGWPEATGDVLVLGDRPVFSTS
jgi:DNA-binding NarL/FixJ family response regulator